MADFVVVAELLFFFTPSYYNGKICGDSSIHGKLVVMLVDSL